MSLVNSIGAALVAAGKFVGRFTWGAPKVSYLEEYEAVALPSGSTITMFTPKKGEKYAGSGQLAWDDLGTGVTLAVGIAGATEKFLAAADAATAADKAELDAGAAAIAALGYEFDGATPVVITTGGAEAAGTIKLRMDFLACN
jgi:hypothetical protein